MLFSSNLMQPFSAREKINVAFGLEKSSTEREEALVLSFLEQLQVYHPVHLHRSCCEKIKECHPF